MRAADRVESGVHATPGSETPYRRYEIVGAIVDRRRAEALDRGEVRGRAGPDRRESEMPREIEQRRADRARSPDDQDRRSRRQTPIAGQHLEGGEIGERNADRLGGIDALRDTNEPIGGANGVLSVAADDAEIGDQLALARRGDASAGLLDDPHYLVARNERQRPLEVGVAAAPDEAVREPGAGGEHLDAHLPRTGLGDLRRPHEFENFGTSEAGYADALPCHDCTLGEETEA